MAKKMPAGSLVSSTIRKDQVKVPDDGGAPPILNEDATATLVWGDYQRAKAFIESDNTSWLLEWQETDILYQSPIPYRLPSNQLNGASARVPRFAVAKAQRISSRAVRRGLFAEQYPFFLRPGSKNGEDEIEAWTYLLGVLLKRMKFRYQAGDLQINGQTLFGTGLGKFGWEEREVVKHTRKRKNPPPKISTPIGDKTVHTTESDAFDHQRDVVKESWPIYEYRRLGTTLFDPKWCTPDQPEESAGYCVDIDFPNCYDLIEMGKLSCYKKSENNPGIPDKEALLAYFFSVGPQDAPVGTQTADQMASTGSMVAHAEAPNRSTSIDPMSTPLLMIERWDMQTVKTIIEYQGRKLTIRNEEHECESMCHTAVTYWPIENSGYGMGLGRLVGPDQRVEQGALNAALRMIAYPMNAPVLYNRGSENAPAQNTILSLGRFHAVDPGPSGDVNKAFAFMKMPEVPADAWRVIEESKASGVDISGTDGQTQRGMPASKQGIGRSATGATRLAQMSDQEVADPVDSFANGCIIPVVKFLIHMVKTKMPIMEIRQILSKKYTDKIIQAIDFDQFLDPDFEVDVLAGSKLAAKQGIQQLIPFFLQIVQQPQLLQFLHEKGDTVDFSVIEKLLLQVSELTQQPDIFRKMTPDELKMLKQLNPNAQKIQAQAAIEKEKGDNKIKQIGAKGQVDLATTLAERAIDHVEAGIPLDRAEGLEERSSDLSTLRQGLPDVLGEQP